MAQVAINEGDENRLKLVAWMDVVDKEELESGLSVSTREGK
jgi:hypothetical protein